VIDDLEKRGCSLIRARSTAVLLAVTALVAVAASVARAAGSPEPPRAKYSEAPMLAERVRRGDLPPLEERLPEEPMVVQPVHEIGQYGGTWHRMMKGSSDFHAYGRCVYEQILRWGVTPSGGIEVGPGLVHTWEWENGDKTLVLHLRKGLKWSDGYPFDADDIMFWWERIARDKNLHSSIPSFWMPNDVTMDVVRIDNYTVSLTFDRPYPIAVQYLAFKGNQWPLVFERAGFFAPRHYLERFLPDSGAHSPAPDDSVSYAVFEAMANDFNPSRPVMSAWKVVTWDPGNFLIAERNPYYWKVDPAGNQLPYLDTIEMEIFLNPEMINFRAVSGRLQMQQRHFNWEDEDLLREFETQRNYRIFEYDTASLRIIMMNLQYPGDAVIRELFMEKRFRIAMSLAIDRELINRLCYRGKGVISRMRPSRSSPDYVEVEGLPDYLVHDPERANSLLDELGLTERDADGYRIGSDGRTLSLIIELYNVKGPDMDAVEIVRSDWEKVGIKTSLKPEERTLYFQRVTQNGEHMIGAIGADSTFPVLSPGRWFAVSMWDEWAHHWAEWLLSGGDRGIEPPAVVKRLQETHRTLSLTVDKEKRQELWKSVIRAHAENMWVIPLVAQGKEIGVLSNDFGNVPEHAVASWITMTPGYLNPETFYLRSR